MSDLARQIATAAARQFRQLMRHQDRFLKAWIAATGVYPTDAEMVVQNTCDGFRVWFTMRELPACRGCEHAVENDDDGEWYLCGVGASHVKADHYCKRFEVKP